MTEKRCKYKDKEVQDSYYLNNSIIEFINYFIKDMRNKAIDINIYSNFFSIKIYGVFYKVDDINGMCINSLLSLCNEVYYITIKDKVKTTYNLNFYEAHKGVYRVKDVSSLTVDDKIDSIAFIIYKNHYTDLLKLLNNKDKRQNLKEYINEIYNNALSYLKIRCFNEILYYREKEGTLLNDRHSEIRDNIKVEIYKMQEYYKDVDIIINGVKDHRSISKKMINWNKYPYRQKGFSFKRLCVLIYIKQDNFDLNNSYAIEDLLKENEGYINNLIEEYKEYFRSDIVYYNLEYDKNKMMKIVKKTGCENVLEAVKYVLDNFYENE